ncbi:DUF4232 domain-containing protein [Streptomyces sp. NPDC048659]|uniref:DUF4232 domain-containing protein n=1 Tax=Streptomyces sp. NPDC048659 TaxID=3155489 RepID=UPI0034498B63
MRTLALPVTAFAAVLALTACQSSDSAEADAKPLPATQPASASRTSAPPAASAPATEPPAATPARTTKPAATPTTRATQATPATAPAPAAPAATRPCTVPGTKIVASRVSRPVNHLALTVTNVGKRPCNALNAPFVGFDEPQAAIRTVEESKPQAVVTLMPGESAYASLILTGEPGPDTHGRTIRTIKVSLTRNDSTTVAAPSGTFADDGAAVSYWQRTLEEALAY